jgi:hypothetical protein
MHPLLRLARVSRLVLPVLLGGAGTFIKLRGGALTSELVLILAAGGLLGWALALAFESTAVLVTGPRPEGLSDRRGQELEREKEIVLRSIKDIELDAALHKLDEADAKELCQPLRQRAVSLLYELDRARAGRPASVEAAIEEELRRRLGGEKASPEEPR